MTSIYVACVVPRTNRIAEWQSLLSWKHQSCNSCYQLLKSHNIYFEKIDNNQHICEEVTVVFKSLFI